MKMKHFALAWLAGACVVAGLCGKLEAASATSGEASPTGGVAFTVGPRDSTVWASVYWTSGTNTFTVGRHLHVLGDGRSHRYYFDGSTCASFGGNGWSTANQKNWKGAVSQFTVAESVSGKAIPVSDITFCATRPAIAPFFGLSHTAKPLAFSRVGQDIPVEIGVFNGGTVAAKGVRAIISGLPEGVTLVDSGASRRVPEIPGGGSWLYRLALRAAAPCSFSVKVTFSDGNLDAPVEAVVPVQVGPSLGLPKAADYIPEPRPLKPGKYDIGALYFCDWVAPRHWMKIWRMAPERKPALGWYCNENPEALDWQIKWSVENGITHWIVDWYWVCGGRCVDYFERAFAKCRFRKYLKWSILWCNHTPEGSCMAHDFENLIAYCIRNYFKTPEYRQVGGCPEFTINLPGNFNRDNGEGSCRRILDRAREQARAAGLKGIFFRGISFGDKPEELEKLRADGYDSAVDYHFIQGKDFPDIVNNSTGYWRRMSSVTNFSFLSSISTSWNDRPWDAWSEKEGKNPAEFRRLCRAAKDFADRTGHTEFCLAPLNEWGEGSYAEPNGEHGFGLFEAVRETFYEKPAEGWPVNCTPADVGRGPYPVPDADVPVPQDIPWR